jgi:hypothetical protein
MSTVLTHLHSRSVAIIAILASALVACKPDVEEKSQADNPPEWSDKEEVIHQLIEVIRYEDMEASLRQEQLEELRLPSENTPGNRP